MGAQQLILIAEDEPDIANLLQHHLQKRGYRTRAVGDGLSALNEAFESKPELIILDLMLPKLHGFDVCRMLRFSPISHHIPVLILTAAHDPESKIKGFELGADDYVTKPFSMQELLARVGVLLKSDSPAKRRCVSCLSEYHSLTNRVGSLPYGCLPH